MDIGMKIGNELTKDAMEPMANAIIRILEARADQKTIREGLRAFGRVAEVKHVTVSHCTINGNAPAATTLRSAFDKAVSRAAWANNAGPENDTTGDAE